jgi:regulatory protein
MIRLVSVEQRSGRHPRWAVVTDAGEEHLLHPEALGLLRLEREMQLDPQRWAELLRRNEEVLCREAAWRMLATKNRSKSDLIRALRGKKFPPAVVEAEVERLAAAGYLNDETFARQFAAGRTRGGKGPRLVELELKSHGIERTLAKQEAESAQTTDDQRAMIANLLEKWNRRREPADPKKRRVAAANHLLRRGFDTELVWDAIRELFRTREE